MDDSAQEQKLYLSNRRLYQIIHFSGVLSDSKVDS